MVHPRMMPHACGCARASMVHPSCMMPTPVRHSTASSSRRKRPSLVTHVCAPRTCRCAARRRPGRPAPAWPRPRAVPLHAPLAGAGARSRRRGAPCAGGAWACTRGRHLRQPPHAVHSGNRVVKGACGSTLTPLVLEGLPHNTCTHTARPPRRAAFRPVEPQQLIPTGICATCRGAVRAISLSHLQRSRPRPRRTGPRTTAP
jgi:hypothetical protein